MKRLSLINYFIQERTRKHKFSIFCLLILFLSFLSCDITSIVLDDEIKGAGGTPRFASGSVYGEYYNFADGAIDAAQNTLGVFLDNVSTSGTLENAEMLVYDRAYLGMLQEDVFSFAQRTYQSQYEINPDTAEKKYLKMASQLKVLLALFREDVHLLVRTDRGITQMSDLAGKNVNIGSHGSGTYITASTILDSNSIACTLHTDDVSDGIDRVVDGTYDAAFFVDAAPSRPFVAIPSGSPVMLIRTYMPASDSDRLYDYDATGTIYAGDYPFQSESITQNLTVKSLLASGTLYDDRNTDIFLDYIFEHIDEYRGFSSRWKDVSMGNSQEYMQENPMLCSYPAICYVASFPPVDAWYLEPNFYSGTLPGDSHDLAVELIWLMSHNIDIDLREKNSTGSWENAYRMLNGAASTAIVQDDIFSYLENKESMYYSMMSASMKKIVPLHYMYLHLLGRTTVSGGVGSFPGRIINVGPKTSGTFMAAMAVIRSYGFTESSNITYHFDEPADSVSRVNNGTYDAMFVMSGTPYIKFYSHDTWNVSSELSSCRLYSALFSGSIPYPYRTGLIRGNGSAVYEDYPYPTAALPSGSITTVRARSVMVASPAFNDSNISTFLKSVFRRSYYLTNPPDPDLWAEGYQPDQRWIFIKKEDYAIDTAHGIYDTVKGAMTYFVENPFGWSDEAAIYYLSMFPDNQEAD